MDYAKLKVIFRIPWTIYWLAWAIYKDKRFFCLAIKEFDPDDGKYYYFEISLREDIDCHNRDLQ